MDELADTLVSFSTDQSMAAATARRQEWSAKIGLKRYFNGEPPKNYREFLEAVEELESSAPTTTEPRP